MERGVEMLKSSVVIGELERAQAMSKELAKQFLINFLADDVFAKEFLAVLREKMKAGDYEAFFFIHNYAWNSERTCEFRTRLTSLGARDIIDGLLGD